MTLSPGQDADISHADELLDGFAPAVVIGDKGYDKQALVDAIEAKGGEAVIPTLKTRKVQRTIDTDRYKDRNWVERFWATLKPHRRVATRYDKTSRNFLAFVHVAATMILLRQPLHLSTRPSRRVEGGPRRSRGARVEVRESHDRERGDARVLAPRGEPLPAGRRVGRERVERVPPDVQDPPVAVRP